jgi:colanic acid/amylovoran biosynthesis glycosyltransferase
VTTQREKPLFAWYSNTYLYRSENFLHRQLCGMSHANVHLLAQWTTNLEEFPAPQLYCAESATNFAGRIKNALLRRAWPQRNRYTLRPYLTRRFAQQIKAMRPDLMYCMFAWHASQLLDVLATDGCRNVPLVYHAAGSDILAADSIGPEYVARLRETFERAAVIVCGSQFLMSRVLLMGAPAEKVKLHYIGIDIPEARALPRDHRELFRILAVSRVAPVKGVQHTIRAFAMAASEMPQSILEIIGDGEELSTCIDLSKQLNIAGRVIFRGSLPVTRVYAAMRSADVFVQHNVRTAEGQEEAIGGSPIEAAAHGLPVIGTQSGGVGEAVVHGKTGLLGQPGDEKAMAESMLQLYQAPELRLRYGSAGRERAKNLFDLRKQNWKLEQMLLEASGQASPAMRNLRLTPPPNCASSPCNRRT